MRHLAIAILVATLAPVGAAMPAEAKAPGTSGRIVFDDGDGPIYTVSPDGTRLRQIAFGHDVARWSANGRKISMVDVAPDGRITTAVVKPDGSNFESKSIPDPTLNLQCPAWAPHGVRLACEGWDDVHPERPAGIFGVRAADWRGLRRVTTNPYGGHDIPGDYSPDGTRIAFLREDPPNNVVALFIVKIDGSGVQRITPWGVPDCCTASWSPDGRWILFGGQGSLFVVRPDGAHLHQIPLSRFDESVAFHPGWSPDGRRIVFALVTPTGAETQIRGIYTADADGTDVNPVFTTTTGFPSNPDWGRHKLG